jgi:AcrR family transcriptional regulator
MSLSVTLNNRQNPMSQTGTAEDDGRIDGRVERTATTRRNILSVTRELILEGSIDPTARQIADRAGITTRTLFRHFPDMESLHRSFIEDTDASASLVMDEPFPDGTSDQWRQRLDVVIDRRVRVYESLLPLYISTIWSRYRAAATDSMQHRGIARRRKRLRDILPDGVAKDPVLFEALDGVLSIEYWISLRRDQRLSAARATRVVSLAVEKLTALS